MTPPENPSDIDEQRLAALAGAEVGSRPWLHAFAMATRGVTLAVFPEANTCIATTLIGQRVLAEYGIKATPTSVWVEAINAKAFQLREQGIHPSQWPDDAWNVLVRSGANGTDVVADNRTGGWDGHLVLVLRRGPGKPRTLIDLTADQFDRPQRALRSPGPFFMDIAPGAAWTPDDPIGNPVGEGLSPAENPTLLIYTPAPPGDPESARWRTSHDADWLSSDPGGDVARVVERIIEGIGELTSP